MPEQDVSLKDLFTQALEHSHPDERKAFLDEACRDDHGLRCEVESLLEAYDNSAEFLDDLTPQLPRTILVNVPCLAPGTKIGPYTLKEEIGEGGMGVVYLAEQKSPVAREVAIKIVKPGMDSKQILARFEAERQALALMSHPYIARILDGGATEFERPFFVMEFVDGLPIHDYCDEQTLSVRQRLELFLKVCEAVQHAHQKGIIHRDLKPGNILVENQKSQAIPKIIDFGIAKALHQRLTQYTIYTHFDQLVGTPEYMSPEQARLSDEDIDTRSDIYSLGVILYELLTGRLPYNLSQTRSVGYQEVRDKIRNEEPSRPSETVNSLDRDAASTISQQRQTTSRELVIVMRRELDWIVLKSLEKQRERRYEDVGSLIEDVQRYLAGEAVEACPPSTVYRLRKFLFQHRKFLTAASLVLVTALVGMLASLRYADQAADALHVVQRQSREIVKVNQSLWQERQRLVQERYAQDIKSAHQFWVDGDLRNFTDMLDRYADLKTGADDPRGFEWWYLRQLAEANGQILDQRDEQGCLVRYSPDGKYLVLGWTDGQIDLRDANTHERVTTFTGLGHFVNGCDFHPTEPILATIADDGMIRLWDLETEQEIRQIRACDGHAHRVFFNADGSQLVSSGEEDRVRFWETSTGESLGEISGFSQGRHGGIERRLAISPSRRILALADTEGRASVYDFQTREEICRLESIPYNYLRCLTFSPDGKSIAGGMYSKDVHIWSVETGRLISSFTGHLDQVNDLAFHPSGKLLVSGDHGGVIRTWPIATAASETVRDVPRWPIRLRGHDDRVLSLDFSPDGNRLVTGSRDETIKIWSHSLTNGQFTLKPASKREIPRDVAFDPHNPELWINGQQQLEKWNPETNELQVLAEYPDKSTCMAMIPGKPHAVCGYIHGGLILWDMETGESRTVVKGTGVDEFGVTQLSVSRDGSILLVARGNSNSVEFWDISSGTLTEPIQRLSDFEDGWVMPEGKTAILHRHNILHEYDLKSDRFVREYTGHSNSVEVVTCSAEGRLLISGSDDRTIRVWDRETGSCLRTIPAHDFPFSSLAISPDGRTLASGDHRGHVSISHLPTGRILFKKPLVTQEIRDLKFSPNDRSLAIVQETGITLLEAAGMPARDQ